MWMNTGGASGRALALQCSSCCAGISFDYSNPKKREEVDDEDDHDPMPLTPYLKEKKALSEFLVVKFNREDEDHC